MKNLNSRIAAYFLNNNRLTLLALGLLVILGVGTTALLRTTGFPEPEIKVAFVQTVYPGASAETMAETVTTPIEGSIKDVSGVKSYQSTSNNSVSVIRIDIDESADADTVRNKITSSISTIDFPNGVQTPEVNAPEVSGPDLIISVAGENLNDVYTVADSMRADLAEIPETASVEPFVELERRLVITVDQVAMAASGVTTAEIQQQLDGFDEKIPVVSNVEINDENHSILTATSSATINDIRTLSLQTIQGSTVELGSIADIKVEYAFADPQVPYIAVNAGGEAIVVPALTFAIKASRDADLGSYTRSVEDLLRSYDSATYIERGHETNDTSKPWVMIHNTAQEFSDQQVSEVVSGLIGGKLDIAEPWGNIGWILGGIQLVFLVMVAFVSWRAALVAAISIPLSLIFANIYLYFTGNDLNALVLFSLVLVIGLVVDPALVILESIQRKIDIGLKGKAAALAAIDDVGRGLFLATLTNIIVFLPFGLISGLLGEIFSYIPLTIIPAVIGSYLVPLIFLAWLGGLVLRPGKRNSNNEEQNLWGAARWLIAVNMHILRSPIIVRAGIILLALVVPLVVTAWYFTSGNMKVVQFASSTNADYLMLEGQYTDTSTPQERSQLMHDVTQRIAENENVLQVFPMASGINYFVTLKPAKDRDTYSDEINQEILTSIEEFRSDFFDIGLKVNSVGPPTSRFSVAISIAEPDADTRKTTAIDIGKALYTVCKTDDGISVKEDCSGDRMIVNVDDGYTGKASKVIEIIADREAIQKYQLAIPNAPITAAINQIVRQLYPGAQTDASEINLNDSSAFVHIETSADQPTSVTELRDVIILQTPALTLTLDDVADVQEVTAESSITRVKGQTLGLVQGALKDEYNDQGTAAQVTQAVLGHYQDNDSLASYSEGSTANNNKSFQELFIALLFSIILTYIVLAVFFSSFTQPLVILFSVPLSFLGIFPALAYIGNGQFGFLEIIGLIILVGLVENVAIFLIDAARQQIAKGADEIRAISYAAGVRLRPVLMTKCTAIASLAPLAFLSETYRSISLVIMFGLLTSGITSLFTTPILYIFFRWLSAKFHSARWYNKIGFFLFAPIYLIVWAITDRRE